MDTFFFLFLDNYGGCARQSHRGRSWGTKGVYQPCSVAPKEVRKAPSPLTLAVWP